jgi:hypothetical protein
LDRVAQILIMRFGWKTLSIGSAQIFGGTVGKKISTCKDLDDDIKKGEEAGLELNFYCPTCENTLPVNPKK